METDEKITVIHDNKFETVTLGKTRFFFNLPRKFFIPIFILLIILIPILIYLYTQSQKNSIELKPAEVIPDSSNLNPSKNNQPAIPPPTSGGPENTGAEGPRGTPIIK